jgi:hypothetical protein
MLMTVAKDFYNDLLYFYKDPTIPTILKNSSAGILWRGSLAFFDEWSCNYFR